MSEHAPRGELRRYPIGHFDLFHPPWSDRVIDDQLAFLRRTLPEPDTQDDAEPLAR
ncbi:hypothetical protein [Nocardia cyriacigeorgica]|uniref:hypothetical protein n=1 Tax=Nocardia cyriacigeorgica TaxID=135487 RepID=UPI0018946405|nr:hypothetical protein [Nocardia cyriacigeorgica]MBF6439577.1 hypothetical protein [Nocardia cyriacigeorgica]